MQRQLATPFKVTHKPLFWHGHDVDGEGVVFIDEEDNEHGCVVVFVGKEGVVVIESQQVGPVKPGWHKHIYVDPHG